MADAKLVQAIASPIMESYGLVPDFDCLDYELGHFGECYHGSIAQLVACSDGVVVGSVILKAHQGEVAKLTGFYIAACHQGKGVGKRLLGAAIQRAKSSGHRAIYLETWDKMAAATALYKRFGWKKITDLPPESGAQRGYCLDLGC
ncbi:GNAT family N-acetyltransferase [Ferrimonas sediminicola]|uniref:GNAT family N-acetyltransferase n=1 Tax=Ferrimonas sediminicola TaxID=2569538 RepID=UPI00145EAD07|nr:GNAT family N-acetyltransferase [Ferrimonas sediminicola]